MDDRDEALEGGCHCGAVRLRVRLKDGYGNVRRCNCSICAMRGAVCVSARLGDIEIAQGADALTEYRFNTGTARHFFCSRCGVYTHHQRRSNPEEYSVNVACLDGLSPFDFAEVPVIDGRGRHPSDTPGGGYALAGMLRFVTADR
jgi:hypothetical protein